MADVDARGIKRTKVTSTFHSRVDRLLNAADMTSLPGQYVYSFPQFTDASESFGIGLFRNNNEKRDLFRHPFPISRENQMAVRRCIFEPVPLSHFWVCMQRGRNCESAIYGDVRSYECKLLPLAL